MKHLLFILVIVVLCSCTAKKEHNVIFPLPDGITLNYLSDCTLHVSFSDSDFNWDAHNLKVKVFREYIYDAVDANSLQIGDTLYLAGEFMPINDISSSHGYIIINGDIEEGGACLKPNDGGTYRATITDDHSQFTPVGDVCVTLDKDFKLIDCGDNPEDSLTTITSNYKAYLDKMPDYKKDFNPMNTTIRIEKGAVKEIQRIWIP